MNQIRELGRFVRLARGEDKGQGKAVSVSNQVEFAAPSAAAAAQRVVVGFTVESAPPFLRAPAAERDARTLEPSTSHKFQSIFPFLSRRIRSALRILSKVPSRR